MSEWGLGDSLDLLEKISQDVRNYREGSEDEGEVFYVPQVVIDQAQVAGPAAQAFRDAVEEGWIRPFGPFPETEESNND